MVTKPTALQLTALAQRSSYVENVLRHALIAQLSSLVWRRDPLAALEVFNAEVDSTGFDVVLSLGGAVRYVQLKQAHAGKVPASCSIRSSFAEIPGACLVLMSHTADSLELTHFRFFGGGPGQPMGDVRAFRTSKSAGRRSSAGVRKTRENYKDVPRRAFEGPMTASALLERLFPSS
jgi:hypothetical protein